MSTRTLWSRRRFLQYTGTLTAASSLPTIARASLLSSGTRQQYAYVGSMESYGSLHVFAVDNIGWTPLQTIASAQPAALALHPTANVLYVANHISVWQGLPCGSVEAYRIDPLLGTLTKLGQQPLALSATLPTGLTVSPDGRHLVVASYGGGAYNLLPLSADGGLQRVAVIVKEIGRGPHPHHQQAAHPHTMLMDPAGKYLLGSDTGTDRLNSFRLEEDSLERAGHTSLQAGSGPSQMAFHPYGHLLYVANQLTASITGFTYHASEGRVGKALWSGPLSSREFPSLSLAIHPTGRLLYTAADEIVAWKIDLQTGALRPIPQLLSSTLPDSRLVVGPDSRSLYMVHEPSGKVQLARVDPSTGGLGQPQMVAKVAGSRSLLFVHSTGAAG